MLTSHIKISCPYCIKVLNTGKELGVEFKEKNIADDLISEEFVKSGEKRQVPYLIDSERTIFIL